MDADKSVENNFGFSIRFFLFFFFLKERGSMGILGFVSYVYFFFLIASILFFLSKLAWETRWAGKPIAALIVVI